MKLLLRVISDVKPWFFQLWDAANRPLSSMTREELQEIADAVNDHVPLMAALLAARTVLWALRDDPERDVDTESSDALDGVIAQVEAALAKVGQP